MKRVNRILRHPLYQKALEQIGAAEETRIFCKHDMEHFLAVARLVWIYDSRQEAGIPRELIYAAALLHDIGRAEEYEKGRPHHEAGAELAGNILRECGFSAEERRQIGEAILFHRDSQKEGAGQEQDLPSLLYKADKASRNCFVCGARAACKWRPEAMNMEIRD